MPETAASDLFEMIVRVMPRLSAPVRYLAN